VEYETRLNYVLPKYDDPVICTYDLSKFPASMVMDIMRTHPVVIIGGILQENPFFVPPDQFSPRVAGATVGSQKCRHGELNAYRIAYSECGAANSTKAEASFSDPTGSRVGNENRPITRRRDCRSADQLLGVAVVRSATL